jgi:hypothetical protein
MRRNRASPPNTRDGRIRQLIAELERLSGKTVLLQETAT